ncbi:hypothetical protein [Embleya scabrispora]|uniref:hypothetical protein n=1 Tax=Embleya scabrispora TaxID=159449 RepID=UPI001319D259|nr:hypothetical protein [Embleya scabrispora]MYS87335.1 hypothetical protein [Streptomyces sp. SID5474]
MPARSVLRAVRAAMFAVICVLLALFGHTLMSDAPVHWAAPVGAGVGIGILAWAVADRERGLGVITGAVLAAQAGLHTLFTLARQPVPEPTGAARFRDQWLQILLCNDDRPGDAPTRSVAELLIRMRLDPNLAGQSPEAAGFGRAPSGGHHTVAAGGMNHDGALMAVMGNGAGGMFAAHVLAALGCGVWLRHGEKAVFRLLRLLATMAGTVVLALVGAWTAPVATRLPGMPRARDRGERAIPKWVCRPLPGRGPPAALFA